MLDFERVHADGLQWHVATASDDAVPIPCWPGLWQQEYPEDDALNPFFRFGVNNGEGEIFAVWRAIAWHMTSGTTRFGLPRFDRDQVAARLGVDQEDLKFIGWEYDLDYECGSFAAARKGFVPARSCVPISPPPTAWQRDHGNLAAIFPLNHFADFTTFHVGLAFDVSSESSLFGLRTSGANELRSRLSSEAPPVLARVIGPGDVFVHTTIVHDRYFGWHSYLAFAARHDLSPELERVTLHYAEQWNTYRSIAPSLDTFEDFIREMERLVSPPEPVRE